LPVSLCVILLPTAPGVNGAVVVLAAATQPTLQHGHCPLSLDSREPSIIEIIHSFVSTLWSISVYPAFFQVTCLCVDRKPKAASFYNFCHSMSVVTVKVSRHKTHALGKGGAQRQVPLAAESCPVLGLVCAVVSHTCSWSLWETMTTLKNSVFKLCDWTSICEYKYHD
jgi:hypothetical protein